jgi:hypothetical protein
MAVAVAAGLAMAGSAGAADRPIIDTHIHYSHDAWERLPPPEAIKVLRAAGLRKAFVSSSSDDGTQKLYKLAPDLIVPVLRPYRKRGEIGTWFKDRTVVDMLKDRLSKNRYAGIGEFHIYGADADSPVMRAVVQLAKKYGIFLHLHGDADAVRRVFAQHPGATALWAHSGFADPSEIRPMLARYKRLWADLAFRSQHASGGTVEPEWLALFKAFPDRFMVGTDTFAPERWYFVKEHAAWNRAWLKSLPADLADKIAFKNAEYLAKWALSDK